MNSSTCMNLEEIYDNAYALYCLNHKDKNKTDYENCKRNFQKVFKQLFEDFSVDRSLFWANGLQEPYAFPEIIGLLLSTYLSEGKNKKTKNFSSNFFHNRAIDQTTSKEKQQFFSTVISRLEDRLKNRSEYLSFKPKIDQLKSNYEDFECFEKQLEDRIKEIKRTISNQIDKHLQNVGASVGLNEYILNSTIEKIKHKNFSINDFLDIADINDTDSVGLTEIFEKDATGKLKMNHSETKMQLTRDDRLTVINKFEEFLADAMDNWTVYLEEFERERHDEYHQKFRNKCTERSDHETLAFMFPREIISNNLESSAEKPLVNLQYYSSIQETDSGLIANIHLDPNLLEKTESVNKKVMDEYNLMLYDYLINTQTAVSAKHYDNIINFDKGGKKYSSYLKQEENKIRKEPPSTEEISQYYLAYRTNGEISYLPKKTPEEIRLDFLLKKKHSKEYQMYLDNLKYRKHLGVHKAEQKLKKLFSGDYEQTDYFETNYTSTHYGEYYVFSKDLRNEFKDYINKKFACKEKLNKALAEKDYSEKDCSEKDFWIDVLLEKYNSITPSDLLLQATFLYSLNITQTTQQTQLVYILSKKTPAKNSRFDKSNPNDMRLINWRDVYIYNKNDHFFIPYDLILPNVKVRKVRRTNIKKYNCIGRLKPKKLYPDFRLKFQLMFFRTNKPRRKNKFSNI
ncbi:hypothetical protein GH811_02705 [Acetobacterium malicum]|uniref:Uncharacterized protein n=1 Tax=Acetobacterium malicum TaxID=52692 RepID=A0ABR6YTK7_9FIRM|nr:hypothetical protein [Acetobacterium malicum]MBC3898527.1 hypothetical protein [Acetobacterium malicum]